MTKFSAQDILNAGYSSCPAALPAASLPEGIDWSVVHVGDSIRADDMRFSLTLGKWLNIRQVAVGSTIQPKTPPVARAPDSMFQIYRKTLVDSGYSIVGVSSYELIQANSTMPSGNLRLLKRDEIIRKGDLLFKASVGAWGAARQDTHGASVRGTLWYIRRLDFEKSIPCTTPEESEEDKQSMMDFFFGSSWHGGLR